EWREHTTSLGDETDTVTCDEVRATPSHLAAGDPYGSCVRSEQTHDGVDQRGLSRAIAPEKCYDRALCDIEVCTVQHRRAVVTGMQPADLQQRGGSGLLGGLRHAGPFKNRSLVSAAPR